MLLLQLTGLSGAGKSSIALAVRQALVEQGYPVEMIDGDVYRRHLCHDLGFSKADRIENIRRLGFVGLTLVRHQIIVILAAINPYESARQELAAQNAAVKTIHLDCPIEVLEQRDVKGLYRRAHLPPDHPEHVAHFTGISDPYEPPVQPDLYIRTDLEPLETSVKKVLEKIAVWRSELLQKQEYF